MARQISGAILAGGQSRRMGTDKAALLLGGEPLLLRVVRRLRLVTPDVAIIGPPERAALAPGVPLFSDRWPQQGPLGGIATALQVLAGEAVLVVGCDMPFLNIRLLRYLLSFAPEYDAVVVRTEGQAHPLHAVYQKRCLQALEALLLAGELQVQRFLNRLAVRFVEGEELDRFDPQHFSTFNANTPEEWAEVLRLFEASMDRQE